MTWTASILGKQKDIDALEVSVRYSDGVKTKDQLIKVPDGNIDTLKAAVRRTIARLEALDLLEAVIVNGVFDASAPPVDPPPTPDPVDVAFAAWRRDLNRLRSAQELVDLGVILASAAGFVALKNKVTADFQGAFLTRL